MDYFKVLASAYVRGCSEKNKLKLRYELTGTPLVSITEKQADEIIEDGNINGLRMFRFNEIVGLPYVNEALSFLKKVNPGNLLDVGSGKGEFLFRFLRDFPETEGYL
ncbi:MAG: hypothetical protein IJP94_08820 [Clostridia bacterium]|uniref:hypothetical protein n=1 Tax=Ruminococcus sp. TaxID=41978 RepID=UPI002872C9A5|nr:hypothetical protein [Ruminococcus sp.]MBQ3284548.1 hypothetical protein [Ruminococcus sp.]MBR0089927.1 hypothetical protein [Clostridia bacterium]